MVRLILTVFRFLPWWGYAVLTLFIANLAYAAFQDHLARQAAAEQAIRQGPPPLTKVGVYDGRTGLGLLGEVQLVGVLRPDLGLGRIEGSLPKTFVIVDAPDGRGPLVAVMFVGSDAQEELTAMVSRAQRNNTVSIFGFRRTLDRADVRGQLALQGVDRDVEVVEAMVGPRVPALWARASNDLPFAIVLALLAVLSAATAYWRYSGWRSRRGQTRGQRRAATSAPSPAATSPTRMPAAAGTPPQASPWGRFKPQARPPQPEQKRTATQTASRGPASAPASDVPVDIPDFKSVFPGGGSGFRFKSADEIIRETFGTVSTLTKSSPPKDG